MNLDRLESSIEKAPKDHMIVVIKPDAYFHLQAIMDRFKNEGLEVVESVTRILPLDFVNKVMYRNMPIQIQFENAKHFSQGPSVILMLEGDNSLIDKVVSIIGKNTKPGECDEDSLRYLFGEHDGHEMAGGGQYFRNAIHRGKNEAELQDDMEKFKTFFIE
jgi:nucleoside diphosphate kinase